MRTLETFGGDHIRGIIEKACGLAAKSGEAVQFEFNGGIYTVRPDEQIATAKARIGTELGFQILTADEESAKAAADLERMKRESEDAIQAAGVLTEKQLREADVPWPKTADELVAYIKTLVDRPHYYGTCVYAMSMAATAAFHYVAHEVGATGFQASCADLDILRRTRHYTGPFMILDAKDMLYPQYDLAGKVRDFLDNNRSWAAEQATKLLAESSTAHPEVKAHWEKLRGSVHV